MSRQANALFDTKTIKKFCDDIQITDKQRDAAKEWLKLLDDKKLEDETKNYFRFGEIILQNILGYNIKDIDFESDNLEFPFTNDEGKKVVCFEAKGTLTKDLFAPQHRTKKEQETPIKQTWDNMGRGYDYGICTNYRDFVLLSKDVGYYKYHKFDFLSIKDNDEKLKEFVGIFSRQRIIEKTFIKKLYEESITSEREFTKEFYKLFHETRLMFIKEFLSNTDVTKQEAIYYAQIYLNRMIFIFFAEDHNFIPDRILSNRILEVLKSTLISEHSRMVADDISVLFKALNKGSNIVGVFGFNGGLFEKEIPPKIFFSDIKDPKFFEEEKQNSKFLKSTDVDEKTQKILKKYGNTLNPIIKNILIMDSFDFNTEVNVNILGHIFEQSISDLEELHDGSVSKRKREGVFYTPEYVTDYICRNTIIPYLSKSNANTVSELIAEYSKNYIELENNIKEIKIVDPACGSGAFLIKTVDILLEIHKEIQNLKPQIPDQTQLKIWSEESEISKIIETNIYGVDINEESVEITRLSLFLKLAGPNRKLISLSKNIKMGNSLIDDKFVEAKAFNWNHEFPEVMHEKYGGFDIIIGNPPYVRVQFLDHKITDWLKQHKETAYKRVDVSTLFFELAKKILKTKGLVSFITSNQFQVADYGRKTREFILKNFKILHIINFGDLPIFEDALTYVSIFTFQNDTPENFKYLRVQNIEDAKRIDLNNSVTIDVSNLSGDPWIITEKTSLELLDKLRKFPSIGRIGNAGTGLFTGLDELLLLNPEQIKSLQIEKEIILPVLRGTEPERYTDVKAGTFVIYPYKLEEGKTVILTDAELKKYPNAYQYLLTNKNKLLERKDSRKTFKDKKDWFGLTRFGHLEIFNRNKIITPGEVREHKFTIDKSKAGFLNARIFSVIIDDKNYDLKYVLALLNSDVTKFFLRNTAPLKQGGYFAYSSKFLNDVPIPHIDSDAQKKITDKVDKIFELNNSRKEKNEKFLSRLTINLNINITKKFEKFETMEFRDFLNELKKQKISLSLKEQDEWEDYFNVNKNILIELEDNVRKIEGEINDAIYDLYDITHDERITIEEFLKH